MSRPALCDLTKGYQFKGMEPFLNKYDLFSLLACNCNEFGSVGANCTQYGVCMCKPGVLGVKCDQCPQNSYNLSVGCIGKSSTLF